MITLEKQEIKPIFTAEMIQNRIQEMASILNEEYGTEDVCVICVLKGSIMFTVDLIKHLKMPLEVEFIRLSSYGSGTISTGKVNAVDISLPDLNNRNVLIIEDIIDTGYTAQFLTNFIKQNFKVKSYKFISLLDKKCRREVDIKADMYGFDIDDKFLIGYGLDYDGYYRNLNYIGYIPS